ncbi:SusC/RagA family TonB-linked outer membrane protein [Flavobacterium sp.]|uniref:SusC/RagA family TonB-linked outer membrane protein n=1 Tax=Flavobacterium sp. TaxID=239 RepID=UPI002627467D|nr:SusC/RagA family TonB-linked outer membrane protein [Flavobacterium sp.]
MKTIYQKLLFLLLLLPFSVFAQSTLEGVVKDSKSKQPIPGVNVVVQGATAGTSTDLDGKFKLAKLKSGDKIVFSFIGYKNEIVNYNGQSSISVSLEEESNQIQEVVVQVGYGTVKKKDATGSVATVASKDFNKGANVTVENLLNGRVAGLTINTSGAPGSGSQIRIRGGSSLFASNDPLVVVDGLPISNTTNVGSTSFLASLNPSDIETFTVLKDASSTAIYGARASNGVIIITTKKGSKKLSVDYNFNYGSGKLVDKIDVFSADEYRNIIQTLRPGDVGLLGNSNTDWQEAIYRRTDYFDNNLSLKGNLFNKIPARISIGRTYQEGLRLTNEFNRNTVSAALSPSLLKDHLKLRFSANYTNETNRFADGVENSAIQFDPTQPIYDSNSPFGGFFEYYNYNAATNQNALLLAPRNPVAQLIQTNDSGRNNRLFGNIEFDYKFHFLPELRAVLNLGYDESRGNRLRLVSPDAATGGSIGDVRYGTNEFRTKNIKNKLLDFYLVYNKLFGKINFELTGGYSYQKFEEHEYFTGNRYNIFNQDADAIDPTDNVLIGFFGRTNLTFNDKYLLTLSMRRDATSRFDVNNRWGNFPAAAFAWKMKDDFFADSKIVSDFKLRLGWGITGQQVLPSDANNYYLQQYSVGGTNSQYIFGSIPYAVGIPNPYNTNLKWEETTTYNLGFDYGLLNNRITGTLDLFYKKADDMISKTAFADGGSFTNRGWANIGSFTTKGIEFAVNAEILNSKNFKWNVNFNATKFERRIDELALNSDILLGDVGAGTGGTAQILSEGFTPYSFYVYKQLYDSNNNPIEGAYADLNGDSIINGDDRYIYKNPDPDLTLGFASNMNYKNLDFSFNLRASLGNRIYNSVNATKAQYDLLKNNAVLGNIPSSVLSTDFNTTSDVILSDIYIENGSFLRLDNVTLGYTFPEVFDGKASVRLFTGVQNAFVLTKYSGLDPEIANDGRDNTIYPRQRSILFGANVKF